MTSLSAAAKVLEMRGWVVVENAVAPSLVARMLADLDIAYQFCRSLQVANGIGADTEFTVHHLPAIGQDSWLDYLETMTVAPIIKDYFGGPFVLNSFGGALNQARSKSYAHAIHRDIRSYSGALPLMLNTLVMLDQFTEENGATYMMPNGHRIADRPSDEEFYAMAQRATGPAGSVLLFNSNLWHAGGENTTDKPRRSVTPLFSKPFFRPEFDYPRALGLRRFSSELRQILGYHSRVPANHFEFYQPPEKRMYQPGQG